MKRFLILFALATLIVSLVACNTKEESSAPSSSDPSESVASSIPEESTMEEKTPTDESNPDYLYIADTGLYRGTITKIEPVEDSLILTLEEFPGSSYGAEEVHALINDETQMHVSKESLSIGDYVDVYYGGPLEAGIDEALKPIALNFLGVADDLNFNGEIKEILPSADSAESGTMLLKSLTSDEERLVHFDTTTGTQFYMDKDMLEVGMKLNIYHSSCYLIPEESPLKQSNAKEIRVYDVKEDEDSTDKEESIPQENVEVKEVN